MFVMEKSARRCPTGRGAQMKVWQRRPELCRARARPTVVARCYQESAVDRGAVHGRVWAPAAAAAVLAAGCMLPAPPVLAAAPLAQDTAASAYTFPAQPDSSSTRLDLTPLPAPPLAPQQQQAQAQQQASEVASLPLLRFQPVLGVAAAPRVPWPLTLLGIGVANILGLRLVLAALRSWQDSSAPCTLVQLQFGLRLSEPGLQQRLRQLGDMIALGQQGTWLIMEEFVLEVLAHRSALAYGAATATATSVAKGYDGFKDLAGRRAADAEREEALGVVKGSSPEPPRHRGPLGRLMGAPPTEDVEERQQVVVLTLVAAVRGRLEVPPVKDWPSARHALQQVCGLTSSQMMAVELLWTPQDPADFLSEAQLMEDYPHLVDLATGRAVGERGPATRPGSRPSSAARGEAGPGEGPQALNTA